MVDGSGKPAGERNVDQSVGFGVDQVEAGQPPFGGGVPHSFTTERSPGTLGREHTSENYADIFARSQAPVSSLTSYGACWVWAAMTSRKLVLIWRTQRHHRAKARNEMPTRPEIGMLYSDALSALSHENHKLFSTVPSKVMRKVEHNVRNVWRVCVCVK